MKEVLGSLPEVITAYKNYNLLVPTATDVQLNPFYKFHVEEVPVDLGENSGDIFKVGNSWIYGSWCRISGTEPWNHQF